MLSLQHWLDSAGLAAAYGGYKTYQQVKSLYSEKGSRGSAGTGTRAYEILDDTENLNIKQEIVPNKILWDSWENYEKVYSNGQEYAKVGNRLYSRHAVNRLQPSGNRFGPNIYQGLNGGNYGRSVAPQFVEDILETVKPVLQENGNLAYTSGSIKVITIKYNLILSLYGILFPAINILQLDEPTYIDFLANNKTEFLPTC